MKKVQFLFLVSMMPYLVISAPLPINKYSKGYKLYFKTEVLGPVCRLSFVPGTYDWDLQAGLRITDYVHLVGTYGQATFSAFDVIESNKRSGVYLLEQRFGMARNHTQLALRIFPLAHYKDDRAGIFVDLGYSFHHYTGTTDAQIYNNNTDEVEQQYHQDIDMNRYGPQINIGYSLWFDPDNAKKSTWARRATSILSPEIYLGLCDYNLQVFNDKITTQYGPTYPQTPYTESRLKLQLRGKLGIGIFR